MFFCVEFFESQVALPSTEEGLCWPLPERERSGAASPQNAGCILKTTNQAAPGTYSRTDPVTVLPARLPCSTGGAPFRPWNPDGNYFEVSCVKLQLSNLGKGAIFRNIQAIHPLSFPD